jgi:hypothetical protein
MRARPHVGERGDPGSTPGGSTRGPHHQGLGEIRASTGVGASTPYYGEMSSAEEREHREILVWLTSRTIALTLYGVMGAEVGAATLFTGGPLIGDAWPWVRIVIGILATIGGLLTIIGGILGDRTERGWWCALIGTSLMASWVGVVGTGYALSVIHTGVFFSWPWNPVPPSLGRLYIPLLYQSIMFLILLHVATLVRLGRPCHRG